MVWCHSPCGIRLEHFATMHGLVRHEFSLRLLGRFVVAAAKEPAVPVRISSKKGCALLALLAMQPENIATREHLSTMLWGDQFDKNARQNLRQCIASLRAARAIDRAFRPKAGGRTLSG